MLTIALMQGIYRDIGFENTAWGTSCAHASHAPNAAAGLAHRVARARRPTAALASCRGEPVGSALLLGRRLGDVNSDERAVFGKPRDGGRETGPVQPFLIINLPAYP